MVCPVYVVVGLFAVAVFVYYGLPGVLSLLRGTPGLGDRVPTLYGFFGNLAVRATSFEQTLLTVTLC